MNAPTQAATATASPQHRHRGHAWLVWALFAILVVYPLSTGPVFRLVVAGYLPKEIVECYEPLKPFTRVPIAKAFFEWYLFKLWKLERYS